MEENKESVILEPDGDLTLEYLGTYYYAQLEEALSQLLLEQERKRGELRNIIIAIEDLRMKMKTLEPLLEGVPEFEAYKANRAMYVERESKVEQLMSDLDRQ